MGTCSVILRVQCSANTQAQRPHRELLGAFGGDQDKGWLDAFPVQRVEHIQPAEDRHPVIRDDQIGQQVARQYQPFRAVCCRQDVISGPGQHGFR